MPVRTLVDPDSLIMRTRLAQIDDKKFATAKEDGSIDGGKYLFARLRETCDTLLNLGENSGASAANQVGLKERFYVVLQEDKKGKLEFVEYLNPDLVSVSEETGEDWERCFSYPNQVFLIDRPLKTQIKYQNLVGGWQTEELSGLEARMAQHEIDHLNGIRPIDRAKEVLTLKEYLEKNE